MRPLQLPDDIEQRLLEGQRSRATHALMVRYTIPLGDAQILVARWLHEHRTKPEADKPVATGSAAPPAPRKFGRRITDRPLDEDP
jgi:hypothetical protein